MDPFPRGYPKYLGESLAKGVLRSVFDVRFLEGNSLFGFLLAFCKDSQKPLKEEHGRTII